MGGSKNHTVFILAQIGRTQKEFFFFFNEKMQCPYKILKFILYENVIDSIENPSFETDV